VTRPAAELERIEAPASNDIGTLARVIAAAFHHLPASQYLVPDPQWRTQVLSDYFRSDVRDTLEHGTAYTLASRRAVALWMSVPAEGYPGPTLSARLARMDPDLAERDLIFHKTLLARHPVGFAHHHLMILAVRPERQHRGLGSRLLETHHAYLDQQHLPAYLEAASLQARELYRKHGYEDSGEPLELPDRARMYPMLRPPQTFAP
jgi:GNAT superfamily N-acetyltransferase